MDHHGALARLITCVRAIASSYTWLVHDVFRILTLVVGFAAMEPAGVAARLVDARTGAPVAAAEVTVVGSRGSVRSDDDGRFTLEPTPTPPFVVVVLLAGGRVARPIDVLALDPASELVLYVEPAVTDAVTISGLAPRVDVSPGTASTFLTGAEIALRHPATLVQALETVPGIHFVSEGQAAAPSVRGLARGRTLILVDGGRASTERRAGPNASFLDPASISDIEVARGPGSVAYGSDAFGGVIALRTERPARAPGLGVRFTGTLGASTPEQRGELTISAGYGRGGVLVAVRARDFDDYSSPHGIVPDSGWRDRGVRLAWEHDTARGRWFVGWQSDIGRSLGRPRSDANVMRVTSPHDDSHRLTVNYAGASVGPFSRLAVDGLIGVSRQTTEQDRFATRARPRSLEENAVSFNDLQVRITADRPVGGVTVQVGGELLGRYGLEVIDTIDSFNLTGAPVGTTVVRSVDAARRTGVGMFAQAEARLTRRLRLGVGVRGDVVSNRNRGGFFGDRSVSNGAVAGFGALSVMAADGLTLTAQVSRGFRDPTLSDRFYRGPVGRGFIEGNPELEPETSLQVDTGVRYVRGRLRASASFYNYRISDLIERYAASQNLFLFRNRARARIQGAELEVQTILARGLSVEGAAQITRGRDADDRTPLDDIPPSTAAITVRHALGNRLQSYARAGWVGSHSAAGPSEVPTPGYLMLDAGVGWRLSARLQVRAVARNLLDELYYASAGPRWVYAPGRHGSVTVVVEY